MKYLWLWFLPLLYLPNFGLNGDTGMGSLELSDFLMPVFLGLTFLAPRRRGALTASPIIRLSLVFVFVALLSTLLILYFYRYPDPTRIIVFCLMKIAKLVLYGFAAFRICRLLITAEDRDRFDWALLACGLITSVTLLSTGSDDPNPHGSQGIAFYKAFNLISVLMAILITYVSVRYLTGQGTRRWRIAAPVALLMMLAGFTYTQGRGGWLAAMVALLYYTARKGLKISTVAAALTLTVGGLVLYQNNEKFRVEIDKTISPSQDSLHHLGGGVGGFNEGGRLITWENEIRKFPKASWMGTGFFHRGGQAEIWSTGSHNFWLQMFLETGFIGGSLVLYLLWRLWKQAKSKIAYANGYSLPLRSTLIAIFLGGLGGEYFYGGIGLFTALLVYAPLGSMIPAELDQTAP